MSTTQIINVSSKKKIKQKLKRSSRTEASIALAGQYCYIVQNNCSFKFPFIREKKN